MRPKTYRFSSACNLPCTLTLLLHWACIPSGQSWTWHARHWALCVVYACWRRLNLVTRLSCFAALLEFLEVTSRWCPNIAYWETCTTWWLILWSGCVAPQIKTRGRTSRRHAAVLASRPSTSTSCRPASRASGPLHSSATMCPSASRWRMEDTPVSEWAMQKGKKKITWHQLRGTCLLQGTFNVDHLLLRWLVSCCSIVITLS